jgi:hypothetical protein
MELDRRMVRWLIGLALLAGGVTLILLFRQPKNVQQLAASIQEEVSEIRGRPFKKPVVARLRTRADTMATVEAQLARTPLTADYGKVVRMLGLYKGPLIQDPRAAMRNLVQAGAEGNIGYYDANLATVLMEKSARGSVRLEGLAHEVYHAFQDQQFNLSSYLVDKAVDGSLNADEIQARHAVVEGEATYVALLWASAHATGRAPTREMVAEAVKRRSELDREAIMATLQQPNAPPQALAWLAVLQETPAFMYENLGGSYRHGVAFVYAVQSAGWSEVEKLYTDYPPESTEQILHPQKWFSREAPARVKWPAFDADPRFAGWKLLDQNVLGEANFRSVFKEQGLGAEAVSAAQGWGGDRYAVLERMQDGSLLLLWHTTWDTQADASEFAHAYRRLLETKYESTAYPRRIVESGQNVFIVEGGGEASADSFMRFVEEVR